MFYTIFLTIIINITVIVIGYKIIASRLEKKIFNKHIIEQVKEEINKIILNLNKTTTNNISLLENRINKINKLLILTDKKIKAMDKNIFDVNINKEIPLLQKNENYVYSAKKIINQSQKIAENKDDDNTGIFNVDTMDNIKKNIEKLAIDEKVKYLLDIGKTKKEIKKIVGLSSGELELILNISYNK